MVDSLTGGGAGNLSDVRDSTLVFKEADTAIFRRRRSSEQRVLPTLRVVAGPDMLRFCSISPGERVVVGRDERECGLALADPSVSRRHAAITSNEDGGLTLEDLGSTNGTTYRGAQITAPVPLELGEQIQVGSVTLRVDLLGLDELTHLARVVDRLAQAARDPLTGVLGRRYIDEDLPRQIARFHRAHIPVTAVFLDIDEFKKLNDTHGHATGDEVLRTVARLLVMCVRDSDSVARYGGEEFVLVLPNCDGQGGLRFAERVRTRVADYDWAAHLGLSGARITASFGVCAYDGGPVVEWLQRADDAMYEAKRAGRNAVRLACSR